MPCNGWLHSEASELPSPGSGSGSGSTTRSIVAIKQACTDSWGFQGRPAIARGNLLDRVSFLEGGREEEHLMRQTTAMGGVLKTFCKYSARLLRSSDQGESTRT
jgi:hypothetical protein